MHCIAVKPVLETMALLDIFFLLKVIHACSHGICSSGVLSSIGNTSPLPAYIYIILFFKNIKDNISHFSSLDGGFRRGGQEGCCVLLRGYDDSSIYNANY